MPKIDLSMIFHCLYLDPTARPIIQCKRNHSIEQSKNIKDEIDKLKDANFILEVHHPDWPVNMVLVLKKNGKRKVCMDFIVLNKACLKDLYLLLQIDMLVDLIT